MEERNIGGIATMELNGADFGVDVWRCGKTFVDNRPDISMK